MSEILFINACARDNSRTEELARCVLDSLPGKKEEVNLFNIKLLPLDANGIEERAKASATMDFSDFKLAKQFATADVIVVAAPYWDMMFPAVLKTYLENVCVCGITFDYGQNGKPYGMCKAKSLYYVTTSGGYIGENDFGFLYVKALAENFFGIPEVFSIKAEGLDVFGADVRKIIEKAKAGIVLKNTENV